MDTNNNQITVDGVTDRLLETYTFSDAVEHFEGDMEGVRGELRAHISDMLTVLSEGEVGLDLTSEAMDGFFEANPAGDLDERYNNVGIIGVVNHVRNAIVGPRLRRLGSEIEGAFDEVYGRLDINEIEMQGIGFALRMLDLMEDSNLDNLELIDMMTGILGESADEICDEFMATFQESVRVRINTEPALLMSRFLRAYSFGESAEWCGDDEIEFRTMMDGEMAEALGYFELNCVDPVEVADAIDAFIEENSEGTDLDEAYGAWSIGFARFILDRLVGPRLMALPNEFEEAYNHVLEQLTEPSEIGDYAFTALALLDRLQGFAEMGEPGLEELGRLCRLAEEHEGCDQVWFFEVFDSGEDEEEDEEDEEDDFDVYDLLDYDPYGLRVNVDDE